MTEKQQERLSNLAKHLVTISLAALGFVITVMFTSIENEFLAKVTDYKNSLQASLVFYFSAIVFGILVEAAIVSEALKERALTFRLNPVLLLVIAWCFFISGCVALIVFALATAYSIPAINF